MVDVWIMPARELAFEKVSMRDCRDELGLKPGPGLQLVSLPAVWREPEAYLCQVSKTDADEANKADEGVNWEASYYRVAISVDEAYEWLKARGYEPYSPPPTLGD